MGRDYYKLLELPRNANQEEIAKAFRRLGLKHHPMRSATDMATNSYRFSEICEAFEILSNPTTKGIFDQYGEDILKEGFPDGKGNLKGGYKFAGNATEIFERFFGSPNPFCEVYNEEGLDMQGTLFGDAFGGIGRKPVQRPADIEVVLACTLRELYNGCMKEISFERHELNKDEKTTTVVRHKKEIEVRPGFSKETCLRFDGEGNQAFG